LDAPAREISGRFDLAAPFFAFVGSGCLLVLELVAARLIAPTLGVSLYTWTSVIGVVLGGISLGNYLGGKLADRRPTRSTLGLIYLAASAASLLVLGVLHFVDSIVLPDSAPALVQVLWVTALLFFLPATLLGMPTPLLIRLSLHTVEEGGRVVGRVQAAAALGSIFCTFLTGFWLISWFGTRHIVAGVAGVLLVLALLARPPRLLAHGIPLALFAAVIVVSGWTSHSGCTRESNYYCIRVVPGTRHYVTPQGQHIVFTAPFQYLYLDHLLHSAINIDRPTQLRAGYLGRYAVAVRHVFKPGDRLDSFFIGGGAFVFPRYVQAYYRGRITVAEIDPEVTRIAREKLSLKLSPRIKIVAADARRTLRDLPSSTKFDAVFGDAADDFELPFQLTTRQFDRLVAQHLRPNGIYLMTIIDGVHFDFLRSKIRTLRETFPYVALLARGGQWPPHGDLDNYVLIASKQRPAGKLPVISGRALDDFVAHGHSVVLTDDFAPVDQLLAPVFSRALRTGQF
jgi:predicted membrane-bound spermidine synthase